jgi:hypothetical protein
MRCTPAAAISAQAASSEPARSMAPASGLDKHGVKAEPARVHG